MRYFPIIVFIIFFSLGSVNLVRSDSFNQPKDIISHSPSPSAEIIQGNWNILTTQIIENREILVNGSMYVSAPNVEIRNSSIFVMNSLDIHAVNVTIDSSEINVQYIFNGIVCPCLGSGIIIDGSTNNITIRSSSIFSFTSLFEINEGTHNLNFQENSFSNSFGSTFQILSSENVTFNLNHFEFVETQLLTLSYTAGSNFTFTNNTGYLNLELDGTNSKEGVIDKVVIANNTLQGGLSVTGIKNSEINFNFINATNSLTAFNSGGKMIFNVVQYNLFSSSESSKALSYSPNDGDNMTFSFNIVDGPAEFAPKLCNNPVEWKYDVPRYDLDFINNNFIDGITNGPMITLDSDEFQTPETIHVQSACVNSAVYSIDGAPFQGIDTNYIPLTGLKTGDYTLKIITNSDGLFLDHNFKFSYTKLLIFPSSSQSSDSQTSHSKNSRIIEYPGFLFTFIAIFCYRKRCHREVYG